MDWYWFIGKSVLRLIIFILILHFSQKISLKEKGFDGKQVIATVVVVFLLEMYSTVTSIPN